MTIESPAMILVILQFATVILAGFGIKTIIEKIKDDDKKFFDLFQKILIAFFVLFVIFLAFSSSLENLSVTCKLLSEAVPLLVIAT